MFCLSSELQRKNLSERIRAKESSSEFQREDKEGGNFETSL